MDSVRLGPGGAVIRPLGVGTNSWTSATLADAREALAAALSAGLTLVDTAEVYGRGDSERTIGRILGDARGQVHLATKFAPLPTRLTARSVSRALSASLERLGLDRVDLYQVHWPYTWLRIESLMEALANEVEVGRIGGVGVSNYSAAQMRRAHAALARCGIPLISNQVNYSLLHRAPETNGVLDACRELGATLIAYTPLASGALTGKYRPGGARPTGYRRMLGTFRRLERAVPLLDELERVGGKHGRSPAQVALNWLARQDGVVPIPGAKDARQASDNAAAIDFDLSDSQVARLDEVSGSLGR